MAFLVYLLSALASLACAALLLRAYARTRVRLLLWSGVCFAGFFVNNVVLIVGARFVPEADLSVLRSLPLLAGIAALLYGLVWEAQS